MTRTIAEPTNTRSRRTREALLGAAHEILDDEGFEAMTMTAVAKRAGVTRAAAYMHFASRSELVSALFDHIAAREGLAESLQQVWDAPDGVSALEEWAAHIARYHPRLLAVDRALQRVWRADPDAAIHRERVVAEQLGNCRRLAARLVEEDRLAEGWSRAAAADMLFALVSSEMVEALIDERQWSRRRLAEQLALMLRSTFVRSGRELS